MPRTKVREERRLPGVLEILADAEVVTQVLRVLPVFAFALVLNCEGTQAGYAGGDGDLVVLYVLEVPIVGGGDLVVAVLLPHKPRGIVLLYLRLVYAPRSSFDRRWRSHRSSHRSSREGDLNEVNSHLSTGASTSSVVPFPPMRRSVIITFLAFAAISSGVCSKCMRFACATPMLTRMDDEVWKLK